MQSSRPSVDEGGEDFGNQVTDEQELRLSQSISASAIESNPQLALKLAEERLSKGIDIGIIETLQQLQQRDAEVATRLANEIIKKLQSENQGANDDGALVATALLDLVLQPKTQMSGSGDRPEGQTAERKKLLSLNDQPVRSLAKVVVSAALNNKLDYPDMPMRFRALLPELAKLAPDLIGPLNRKMDELERSLDPRIKIWMRVDSLAGSESTEAMLAETVTVPAEMRPALYATAVRQFLQKGETERARQIIVEHVKGPERDQLLEDLDRVTLTIALKSGKLNEAEQVVSGIRSTEQRAIALAQMAASLSAKGQRESAAQILKKAEELIGNQPEDQHEIMAALEVSLGYGAVKPSRAFDLLYSLINRANELLSAAETLDQFGSGHDLFQNGELILQNELGNIGKVYSQYARTLMGLARLDFDGVKEAANQFGRSEVRLMAQLLIVSGILSGKQEAN